MIVLVGVMQHLLNQFNDRYNTPFEYRGHAFKKEDPYDIRVQIYDGKTVKEMPVYYDSDHQLAEVVDFFLSEWNKRAGRIKDD